MPSPSPSLLLLTTLIPLLGAIIIVFIPSRLSRLIPRVALVHAGLACLFSWGLIPKFDRTTSALQFVTPFPWSPDANAGAALGVDGLSFPMVLLTTLVVFVALLASRVVHRIKSYFAWFLFLEFAILGVFSSLSWSLFYVFWEITLVPLFFLVSIWGGKNRIAASMSFFLYTLGGSIFMLVALLALHLHVPDHSFGMAEMARTGATLGPRLQKLLFIGFFVGLAVKIAAFPLHGWLPLVYVEAPTPVSMVLSGVLAKMGAYGLLRLAAVFPLAAQALVPLLFAIGAINIVYGALLAFRQPDLKAMVAYSSISHMGFVLIGVASLNTEGLTGATLQMFTHGLTSSALFLLVGSLYERTHTRDVRDFGGLAFVTPKFFVAMSIALLGSMGLPGLAGFVSELHALIGTFERYGFLSGIVTFGVLVTAGYSLRTLGRLFFGPPNVRWHELRDLRTVEVIAAAPLCMLIIALGMIPHAALALIDSTVAHMATLFPG